MKSLFQALACLIMFMGMDMGVGFQFQRGLSQNERAFFQSYRCYASSDNNDNNGTLPSKSGVERERRHFFGAIANAALLAAGVPDIAVAASESVTTTIVGQQYASTMALSMQEDVGTITLPMKSFVDPQGLFSIDVPEGFYTLRRKSKGDLPNEQGKGRRGSSIFTAGNMAKAEVVAVERFPTRVLLEENGIEATGSLSSFPDIGEPNIVASLINSRREKDKPGASNTILDPASVKLSADGKELKFQLRSEIDVQRPELLMEQYGVDRLFRVTVAKASLNGNDGNLMAVFASALETDFKTQDGVALRKTVDSFQVMDREFGF